jgi:nitroimidazol reductase NimA-like FMN-containing flavoprotein (pyridoxamine 5'-phosphate oxidase superfamily)
MQDPITNINSLHSSAPDNVATPWEEARGVLETAEIFWLSTVRGDGRPHVTPIAGAWLDGNLYFLTGSLAITQKVKNLRGNPHVTLTTGCNHMAIGLDIVVEGDAATCADTAIHERLYHVWAIRFGEGWPIQLRNGVLWDQTSEEPGLLFAVTPIKIFAFARGDEWSQTRYQF